MAGACSVNNPSRLRSDFVRTHESASCFEIEAWIPSELKAISPLVDRLMWLVEASHRVPGNELHAELAFREALNNAVIHGNRLDPAKLVQVRCRCEMGEGVSFVVKDKDLTRTRFPIPWLPKISKPSMAAACCL
jgi:histidine kinase-like protein